MVVDNYDEPNEFKWVRLQITWAPDMVGYSTSPTIVNMVPLADPDWPVTLINEIDLGNGWTSSTYEWRIYPNPTQESFRIGYDSSGGAGGAGHGHNSGPIGHRHLVRSGTGDTGTAACRRFSRFKT